MWVGLLQTHITSLRYDWMVLPAYSHKSLMVAIELTGTGLAVASPSPSWILQKDPNGSPGHGNRTGCSVESLQIYFLGDLLIHFPIMYSLYDLI